MLRLLRKKKNKKGKDCWDGLSRMDKDYRVIFEASKADAKA